MMTLIATLATRFGVSQRLIKVVGIAALVTLAVGLLGIAKCSYDHRLIATHDAETAARLAPVVRQADAMAADTRISDLKRNLDDENAERAAVAPLPDTQLSARQRARACAILMRQAKERGRPVPAGC